MKFGGGNFQTEGKDAVVLLECMSNLAANEMFSGSDSNADCTGEFERMDTSRVKDRIMRGIDALTEVSDHLVIVSINVFDEACSSMMHGPGLYAVSGRIESGIDKESRYGG